MEYELYHHGILGMKWGVRRFQNKDGSLTSAGKKRYGLNKEIHDAEKRDWHDYPKSTHKTDLNQRPHRIAYAMHMSGVKIFNEEDQKRNKAN